jgi:glycosyltransferase involved in cell wall biosynthesis
MKANKFDIDKTMKIIFLLPTLGGGGLERMCITLANEWARNGFDVEMIVQTRVGEFSSLLSPSIVVRSLDRSRIRHLILPLAGLLRRYKNYLLWVHTWPLTSAAIIAWKLSGGHGKLFVSEHTHLSTSAENEIFVPIRWLRLVIKITYPWAHGIIAVSRGVATDLISIAGFPPNRVQVIYNPLTLEKRVCTDKRVQRLDLWRGSSRKRVLTVGNLKAAKNHRLLLHAFKKVTSIQDAELVILGDGPLRADLERQVLELGLDGAVSLPGFFTDPIPWYESADLFVLSSSWEGFGNVIVEAFSFGLPVVSTNCPSGPSEILLDGQLGTLVPVDDPDSLSDAIIHALAKEHDRERLVKRAGDFSVSNIANEYLRVFSDVK